MNKCTGPKQMMRGSHWGMTEQRSETAHPLDVAVAACQPLSLGSGPLVWQ